MEKQESSKETRSLREWKSIFWKILKEKYAENLVLDENRKLVYSRVIPYFTGFPEECRKLDIDPAKGILLIGPVGCGKTSLMKICSQNPVKDFRTVECKKIAENYEMKGRDGLSRFMGGSHYPDETRTPIDYCFEDLALESTLVYYKGNGRNVMADVFYFRHNSWKNFGMKTFATTNKNMEELEEIYGDRITSRISEFMNIISFGDATDLRKL